jgi:hypothetical protein
MTDRNRIEKREDVEEKYMADPQTRLDFTGETSEKFRSGSPPRTPRWVKVFAIIAIVLVMLFVILQVISGGEHGPRRHSSSGNDLGGYTSYSSIIEDLTTSGDDAGGDTSYSSVTQDYTLSSGDLGGQTPPSNIIEHRVQQR